MFQPPKLIIPKPYFNHLPALITKVHNITVKYTVRLQTAKDEPNGYVYPIFN